MIQKLSENFKEVLQNETKPYLLDIYTETCGTCRKIMPFVEEVAQEYGDDYSFYKIDVADVPAVGEEYNVSSTPTLLFIQDGEVKDTHHGDITKEEIVEKLTGAFE